MSRGEQRRGHPLLEERPKSSFNDDVNPNRIKTNKKNRIVDLKIHALTLLFF
jgi:hypothetical protein